ncbi:MAG: glutamate--tRNA ligase family protein [Bacteroidota bacterium]
MAPTPSGFLHRGNAANFALNALLAGSNGEILLRIDDLDRSRFREKYLEDIFSVLNWLGIRWTTGPADATDFHANWSQEHRLPLYQAALDQLRHHPLVFACLCSRKDLAGGKHRYDCLNVKHSFDDPKVAWRLNTRELAPVLIPDLVQSAPFTIDLHTAMPDFVVCKKDGRPSYQPACVVDDVYFNVNRVGRGKDLLPSTAAQAVLSEALGYDSLFERIDFLHHPLLTDAQGSKLSKSAGAIGVSALREKVRMEDVFEQAREWMSGLN